MNKKLLFFIVFLTILGVAVYIITIAQINVVEEPEKCKLSVNNSIAFADNGKKYTGICNVLYNDSILWKTRTYKRGKKTAETGYYIPEGTLEYVGSERDGRIHGDFVSYYRNGEVSIKGKLNNGRYIGEWKYFDDDGSLNKTLYYNKKGEMIDSLYHKK